MSEQEATLPALTARLSPTAPLTPDWTDVVVSVVARTGDALDPDEVAALLDALLPRCDWPRFAWEEAQLAAGTPFAELGARYEDRTERQRQAVLAVVDDLRPHNERLELTTEEVARSLREPERRFGLDDEVVREAIAGLGGLAECTHWPDVGELIPDAFAPSKAEHSYVHAHAARAIVLSLPRSLLHRPGVVRVAGEAVARFRRMSDRTRGLLRLRQAAQLARCRLRERPTDLLAVAWAIEVALW